MLDVHAPHEAAHTWKDFFIHIATIWVCLLIFAEGYSFDWIADSTWRINRGSSVSMVVQMVSKLRMKYSWAIRFRIPRMAVHAIS